MNDLSGFINNCNEYSDNNMTVGIIIGSMGTGGAERVAITLSKWLKNHDEKSIVISLEAVSKTTQYDSSDLDYLCLETAYTGMNILERLKQFDRDNYIDVYIVMGVPMCIYVIPALKQTKAKIIVSERNDPRSFKGKLITKVMARWLMQRGDGFVFQTNDARSYYKKLLKKSIVIQNPITDVPVVNTRVPNELREKVIVAVGRMVPQKNHEMLIKAFARISKDYVDYKLIVYGDGRLRPALQALVQELGISDKIIFPGSVLDLHKRIENAELFVLSSNFEGMPNALMEAMAMGLTCISTDCPCGGPHDLISHKKNGFLIPVGDIEACSNAMRDLLNDKRLSNHIGENALKIRNLYNKDVICSKWLEYIYSVLKG